MSGDEACDLLIVGGGLAGLSAALYGARFGLRTVVLEHLAAGGQVLNVERIEDYPGFPEGVAGFDLGPLVQEQAEAAGATFAMDTATGVEIDGDGDGFRVVCDGGVRAARAVIVAAGSTLRTLGIPGEREYHGKGVSQCASCDASFFIGRDVLVAGGGDAALDEAAVLAAQVKRVYLAHRAPELTGVQHSGLQRLQEFDNVEWLPATEVTRIGGGDTVDHVELQGSAGTRRLDVAGVFVFVGLEPNTAFVRGTVELDAQGHVVVDQHLQTSVPGIFAAGDLRQGSARQLAAAAGDGASAAVFAARYLQGR
jgi:thioredoxin reductase (NADPH)